MMANDADSLALNDGAILVQVARASLEQFVRRGAVAALNLAQLPTAVQRNGATFVTLSQAGRLRGCIGNVVEERPLAESVVQNAIAAASRDPRFPPVTSNDLTELAVEVTVLTPLRLLDYYDYDDLLLKIQPVKDGVMLNLGVRRGVLLPQMWDRISTTADFLKATAKKANISQAQLLARPPIVAVYTFQAQHFMEPG
jgi:AmmeMemoRadiSam system protein A